MSRNKTYTHRHTHTAHTKNYKQQIANTKDALTLNRRRRLLHSKAFSWCVSLLLFYLFVFFLLVKLSSSLSSSFAQPCPCVCLNARVVLLLASFRATTTTTTRFHSSRLETSLSYTVKLFLLFTDSLFVYPLIVAVW